MSPRRRSLRRAEDGATQAEAARLSTGNPEADEILAGGFPKNSFNILMGRPGTGKTILAEQLAFHNADGDRPVLYLTTLSEPYAKVVTYLQGFDFYNPAALGSAILYDDLALELVERGFGFLTTKVREAIKELGPKIILIDSFKAVQDLAPSMQERRRLVAELAGVLSAYETTAFLVGEYTWDEMARYPEFAVADGIVELLRLSRGARDDRYLRVHKLRGSGYRPGRHGFRIGPGGLEIHPRLVAPAWDGATMPEERVSTGVVGLDAMLGGGIWRGASTLVVGPTGSGKTTLAMQFILEGVKRGEPGLFIHFQENPAQMAHLATSLGAEPDAVGRALRLFYVSPVELQIDSLLVEAFSLIGAGRILRVVVDGVGDLAMAAEGGQRIHDYIYALSQHLWRRGITTLFTCERHQADRAPARPSEAQLSYMADNIVLLSLGWTDRLARSARIIKSRGSDHDQRIRGLEIDSGGLHIQ